jgi:hypothetical protein
VEPLDSLRRGVFTGCSNVVLRVSMHARSQRSDSCGPVFGSLVSIVSVFRMCNRVSYGELLVIMSIMFHLCVPAAHKGLIV